MMVPSRVSVAVALLVLGLMTWATPAGGQDASPAAPDASPAAPRDGPDMLAAVELMNLAPAGILETCRPAEPNMRGMVAVANCQHGGGVVVYGRFVDETSLETAYDTIGAGLGTIADSGITCRDGGFEGPYTAADGTVAGRLLCQLGTDGYVAMWTDTALLVLGIVVLGGDSSYAALDDHWLEARLDAVAPDASPATASPPPG